MKRIGSISAVFMACIALVGNSYYPIHATDHSEQTDKRITVVFDLGGVLMCPKKLAAFWQLGPKNLIPYLIRQRSLKRLQAQLYQILNQIQEMEDGPYVPKDPSGHAIPSLLVQWARGDYPNNQILDKICNAIDQHPEWFSNKREQQVIKAIVQLTFNPHNFARSCRPVSEMVKFAKECKQKNYRLYVLSNWDAESFELLNKKYSDIFDLFDGVIISGQVHKVKPDPEIFKLITESIPADTCIFIDDQKENIEAAQQVGMHTVLATPKRALINRTPDMKKIRKEFMEQEKLCGCSQTM